MNLKEYGAPDFDLREFVPRQAWDKFGDKCIWFLDVRIFAIAQELKDTITDSIGKNIFHINNWHYGGKRNWSGLRTVDFFKSYPNAAKYSQHLYGRAFDCQIFIDGDQVPSSEISHHIFRKEELFMGYGLTTVEDIKITKTWNHLDIRNTGLDNILIVG